MSEINHGAEYPANEEAAKPRQVGSNYPTDGQTEVLATIAKAETAGTDNPEDILQELERETVEQRHGRLADFINTHCADLNIPKGRMQTVIIECQNYEDEGRAVFGVNDLQLQADDAPFVRNKILALVPPIEEQRQAVSSNNAIISNNETNLKFGGDIQAINATKISETVTAEHNTDQTHAALSQHSEVSQNRDTLSSLQSQFPAFQSEHGTIGALQQLLLPPPDGVEQPEIRAIVQKVLNIASALQEAVPDKPEVITELLNNSSINFAASEPSAIFAGFMQAADASAQLDEADRSALMAVIGNPRLGADIRNGRDVRLAGRAKQQVIDPETGEIHEEYAYTSQENFAPVRDGVGTYMDGERQMLFLTGSRLSRDITGMPDHKITALAEVWAFYDAAQDSGATGFIESLGATRFDPLSETSFDWLALRRAQDIISALMGGIGAGRDGRIENPDDVAGLLRSQMRLLAGNEKALGWQSNEGDTTAQLEALGLVNDGEPDLEILTAFGSYTQENHLVADLKRSAVQSHLHRLFPDRVDAPAATS